MFPYSLLVLLLCLCKSFQRTLSSFAPELVSQKRMQRYGFFRYTPNITEKNVKYLTFVCISARKQGLGAGFTPYLLYQGDSSCFFAFVKIYTIPVGFLIFWGRHGDSFPPGKSQDDKDAGMEKSGKC